MATVTLNVRLNPEIKAVLVRLARMERRSVTQQIEAMALDAAKKNGLLPANWEPKAEDEDEK